MGAARLKILLTFASGTEGRSAEFEIITFALDAEPTSAWIKYFEGLVDVEFGRGRVRMDGWALHFSVDRASIGSDLNRLVVCAELANDECELDASEASETSASSHDGGG